MERNHLSTAATPDDNQKILDLAHALDRMLDRMHLRLERKDQQKVVQMKRKAWASVVRRFENWTGKPNRQFS